MLANTTWTRRRLLKVSGLSVGAGVASSFGVAGATDVPEHAAEAENANIYVASANTPFKEHGVQLYAVRGGRWSALQFVSSAAPSSLTLSPDRRTLFVTNSVGHHKGLPTGSVEAWAVDAVTGRLSLRNRQTLALTAAFPSHAAVSRNGSLLAVSAAKGGALVLLPVCEDGSVGEPAAVRKELRLTPYAGPAFGGRAAQLFFSSDGTVLLADLREHRLSVLACAPGKFELVERIPLPQACTSVSFVQQPGAVDIRLHDAAQSDLGMMAYAGKLTPLRWVDSKVKQTAVDKARKLLASVASPLVSGSMLDATFIEATDSHGSCLIARRSSRGYQPTPPQAVAWKRV